MNTRLLSRRPLWIRRLVAALGVAAALFTIAPTTQAQRTRGDAAEQATTSSGVVNIQTATAEQLQLLPGIGPSKAEAIIAHRERRAFRRVEDILRVRGVGRATFRRLRPMLTVEGPTTMSAPAPRTTAPANDEE
ncbi:MAG: ComEA family DNA-binding protein [Sandaracinaceae bacterium]